MSGLGSSMLEVMSKNALWVRILGSSSIMEPDNRARFADRVKKANDRLQHVDTTALSGSTTAMPFARRRRNEIGAGDELTKGAQACEELAIEVCKGHSSQIIKDILFNHLRKTHIGDDSMKDV